MKQRTFLVWLKNKNGESGKAPGQIINKTDNEDIMEYTKLGNTDIDVSKVYFNEAVLEQTILSSGDTSWCLPVLGNWIYFLKYKWVKDLTR